MSPRARRRLAFGVALALALAGHALTLYSVQRLLAPPKRIVEQQRAAIWLSAPPAPATTPPRPADAQLQKQEPAPSDKPVSRHEEPPPAAPPAVADEASPSDRAAADPDQLAKYLPASVLTRRPLIAAPIDLEFQARDAQVVRGGSARFVVLISAEGRVDRVVIEYSTLDPDFQSFALSRLYGARFAPGEIGGVPVPSRAIFEVSDDGR